jgi:hypothetical protein
MVEEGVVDFGVCSDLRSGQVVDGWRCVRMGFPAVATKLAIYN